MPLKPAIDRFYYQMTLSELRLLNRSRPLPGISYNSLLYLDLIEMTPDCTVSKLADALHISRSAVTIKMNELLRKGLVRKVQCDKDRRVHYIAVDPESAAVYRNYDAAYRKALAAVEKEFPSRDVETFCAILGLFSDVYTEERDKDVAS